ncbi:hypothetical protein BB560_000926 [Smittium megazygosporum]|uniref:Peptidase S1 domain-containing protein n=1 Tax=Smittium megazygosporum TaxID=133381 RepID=A0A2T9ZIX3_9FUNG|nr:hypothetical protein BB560_000926 [Smittium megazygosporum]
MDSNSVKPLLVYSSKLILVLLCFSFLSLTTARSASDSQKIPDIKNITEAISKDPSLLMPAQGGLGLKLRQSDSSVSEQIKFTSNVLQSGTFIASLAISKDGVNTRACTTTIIGESSFLTSYKCLKNLNLTTDLSSLSIFAGDENRFVINPQGSGLSVAKAFLDDTSGLALLLSKNKMRFNKFTQKIPISIRTVGSGDTVFLLKPEPYETTPFNRVLVAQEEGCKALNSNFTKQSELFICTNPTETQTKCNDKYGGDPIVGFTSGGLVLLGISGEYTSSSNAQDPCSDPKALRFSTKVSNYLGFIALATQTEVKNLTSDVVLQFTSADTGPVPDQMSLIRNISDSVTQILQKNGDNNATSGEIDSSESNNNATNTTTSSKSSSFSITKANSLENSYSIACFAFLISMALLLNYI